MHDNTEVERIKGGSDIKGTGTFKFHIEDDKGGVHLIKIPSSKYVSDLKLFLLSPHHWAQEAKDHYPVLKGTRMGEEDEALMLIWKQRKHRRTILYHPQTNTLRTAPALRTYHAFVALFEAAEAQCHQWEHVLQIPGQLHLNKEFTAKENVHTDILKKPLMDSEGATSNNLTVQVSNLSSEKGDKEEKPTTRMGPLIFDVNPKFEDRRKQPSQAHALALPPRPPGLLQTQATHSQWRDPTTSDQGQASCLHGMPLWCYDQGTLERTRDFLRSFCGVKLGW